MRHFDINNELRIYKERRVSFNRTGYAPLPEPDLLRYLANAVTDYEALGRAIQDMRHMLMTRRYDVTDMVSAPDGENTSEQRV